MLCHVVQMKEMLCSVHACNADESDGQRLLTLIVLVRYTCMCNDTSVYFSVTSAGMRVREKYEWLKGIERTKIDKKGWTLEIKNSPRQPDHISCGMFTCQVMRSEKGWRSNHISGAGDGRQIVPVLASINHFKSSSIHTTMIDDDLLFE